MRLRNVKDANNILINSGLLVEANPFNDKKKLCIEIGTGKGDFIIGMARNNPDVNFIGIEKYPSVLVRAVQKIEDIPDNLRFMCFDAKNICDYFDHNVDTIYLNFSDPWPKKRHAKRRLTSPDFLNVYRQLLKKDGLIEFKTDNRGLFEYSLQSVTENHYHLDYVSLDLHNSPEAEDNIMTEYERKFSVNGPIYKMILSDTMEKNNG